MKKWGAGLCFVVLVTMVGVGCDDGPVCGDGFTSGRETCDDGNSAGGDGCDAACTTEAGWSCVGTECTGVCNDGMRVADEVCDPSDFNSTVHCSSDCSMALGSCGDGTVQTDFEACDSGTNTAFDGCDTTCAPSYGHRCSRSPAVCDASSVDPDAAGSELTSAERAVLCQWFIATLGGAGTEVSCGSLIFTINTVSGCAPQLAPALGSCTVAQFEQWVAERGNACDVLQSTVPVC